MGSQHSDVVTIAFSRGARNESKGQKLTNLLMKEFRHVDLKTRCLPLDSLIFDDKKDEIDSPEDPNDMNCPLISIANDHTFPQSFCYKTLIIIFEDCSNHDDILELDKVLNEWISDFRVGKDILRPLKLVLVVITDENPTAGESLQRLLTDLKSNFIKLGSSTLLKEVIHLDPLDFGQVVFLVNQIKELHDNSDDIKYEDGIGNHGSEENYSDAESAKVSENDIENLVEGEKTMVSEKQRKALTKQGYKLIGDHSAVKLCRWTKSRVRGHGGCYKHTFYGINSNQCMEMTPSLACANKCVFCWRHHTNPVATRWKWQEDDPAYIAQESVKAHLRLIKELRGILDVKSDRFQEAQTVRHCALSLVGEPIMYPQINKLLEELHSRNISSFLVTNAQFPQEMENLKYVTQLYVSIDASDEISLKNIDRPLFRDFWNRFQKCISLLKRRKERTVFRLTLVRHFNMSDQMGELQGYANLIQMGEPDFIEIKAVTFCGTVHDNAITLENVPWHDEVVSYAEALVNIDSFTREHYEIACEHKHSCCILIAKKNFKINDKWHTWIDYEKFNKLVKGGSDFYGIDYSAETPSWAVFGAEERGFDPADTRIYTKGRKKLNGPLAVQQ